MFLTALQSSLSCDWWTSPPNKLLGIWSDSHSHTYVSSTWC